MLNLGLTAKEEVKRLRTLLNQMHTSSISTLARAKFEELDENKNGILDGDEVIKIVDWVLSVYHPDSGITTDDEKLKIKTWLMKSIDSNQDGKIDLIEFATLFEEVAQKSELMRHARLKFSELDISGNGTLENDEIEKLCDWVLQIYNPVGATEREREITKETFMLRIDKNKDGKLGNIILLIHLPKVSYC